MAKWSDYTIKTRRILWILRGLNLVLLFVPVIVYVIVALANGGVTVSGRVSLVASVMVSIILTTFNVITKIKLRSPRWIMLIGLYVAFRESLLPLIVMLAVTSALDDFFFTPMIAHFKAELEASKVIDKRFPQEEES